MPGLFGAFRPASAVRVSFFVKDLREGFALSLIPSLLSSGEICQAEIFFGMKLFLCRFPNYLFSVGTNLLAEIYSVVVKIGVVDITGQIFHQPFWRKEGYGRLIWAQSAHPDPIFGAAVSSLR